MSKPPKPTLAQRLGEADPVLSMGQRAWDLISSQWPAIVTFFGTGGGVTGLAYLTDWAKALGPLGIGLIALATAATGYLIVACSLLGASKRHLNQAMADATNEWKKKSDQINPLDTEFSNKRIRLDELMNPITRIIDSKIFIVCELIGPANIVFHASRPGAGSFNGVGFVNCDVAVVKEDFSINNSLLLKDSKMLGGKVYNCTLLIPKEMVPVFNSFGLNFVTLTGFPEIDNRPPQDTEGRTQP